MTIEFVCVIINMPKAIRAFSSVGRASPLQGEGQKFESSNAHHKKDNDICYCPFYIDVLIKRTFFWSSSASELRLEWFCQRLKICRQNPELPLNANEQDSLLTPTIIKNSFKIGLISGLKLLLRLIVSIYNYCQI